MNEPDPFVSLCSHLGELFAITAQGHLYRHVNDAWLPEPAVPETPDTSAHEAAAASTEATTDAPAGSATDAAAQDWQPIHPLPKPSRPLRRPKFQAHP